MPKASYLVWRINPDNKTIAPMLLDATKKDFALVLQRMIRATALGHRHLLDVDNTRLLVAADAEATDTICGWRIRGTSETTAGIGVLFGQGPNGGLIAAPVDRKWIERHIVWTSPEETGQDEGEDDVGDLATLD